MAIIVKVDEKGRVVIHKEIRDRVGVTEGGHIRIEADDVRVIIKPLKPVAERFYGAFKIERWPEDLDEYASEALKQWWRQRHT